MLPKTPPTRYLHDTQNVINTLQDEELAHIMMGKKTKRLYGRMQHGIQKKKEIVDRLTAKRKSLESEKETNNKRSKKAKK